MGRAAAHVHGGRAASRAVVRVRSRLPRLHLQSGPHLLPSAWLVL